MKICKLCFSKTFERDTYITKNDKKKSMKNN